MAKTVKKQHTRRKYTESHWLIFGIQGLIAMLAGWALMFSNIASVQTLVIITAVMMLCIGFVELFNILHRRVRQHDWGIPLFIAIFEIGVSLSLLFTSSASYALHIAILAAYVLIRSIAAIVVGSVSFSNLTDRFLWIIIGMVGAILAFVIFADPGYSTTDFIKIFGSYLVLLGFTNIIFSLHSKDQLSSGQK